MAEIQIGEKAPLFTLPDQDGKLVHLQDYIGKCPLVVFFYPADFSRNCTREVCAFRDNYELFQAAGAEVIGISRGTQDSHQSFHARFYLPYILLNDADDTVRRLWGVPKAFGILTGRVTYVLDYKGIVRNRYAAQTDINGHIKMVQHTLKQIAADLAKEA